MAKNTRRFRCPPEAVFEVLSDAWLYPSWVVGASRMRAVEASWPGPRARLHHSVGTWPLLLNDKTVCLEWDPPRRMVLEARGWPFGTARVQLDVKPTGDGCVVRMTEHALRGPMTFIPRPVADLAFRPRNAETLKRLAFLAEGRFAPATTAAAEERDPSS